MRETGRITECFNETKETPSLEENEERDLARGVNSRTVRSFEIRYLSSEGRQCTTDDDREPSVKKQYLTSMIVEASVIKTRPAATFFNSSACLSCTSRFPSLGVQERCVQAVFF